MLVIQLHPADLGGAGTADVGGLEENPVAHLIQKAMLEYPQKYGPSLGPAAYFAKSVTPSASKTSSSIKKLPVHSRDGRLKIA